MACIVSEAQTDAWCSVSTRVGFSDSKHSTAAGLRAENNYKQCTQTEPLLYLNSQTSSFSQKINDCNGT